MSRTFAPSSPKQEAFLNEVASEDGADIVLFGGAAGCFDADTEFLSESGWVRFSDYSGESVAQYDPGTDSVSFVKPTEYIKLPCTEFKRLSARGLDMCLSPEHRVAYWATKDSKSPRVLSWNEVLERHTASVTKGWTGNIKTTFSYNGQGIDLTEGEIKEYVAVDRQFPSGWWRCSGEQLRFILGAIKNNSSTTVRYFTKHKCNADFIQFVFAASGLNTSYTVDGRDGSFTVNGTSTGGGFRSFANKDGKAVIETVPSVDGFKYCFSVPSTYLLVRRNNKVYVSGNSGKSYLGVMSFLTWVTRQDMNMFRGVILRRTMVQVSGPGGPAETGQDIYQNFEAQWKVKDSKFVFPNKATIVCKGCEQEKDKYNFQGWQVSVFLVDEAQQFEESQVVYFISRMRTEAPMRPRMIMTANPDYDSYLRVWLEDAGYLDDKGFPRPEMDGVKTWFIRLGNDMIWAKTREELLERYGKSCGPMSFTFFPATCLDNPVLLERDPSYLFKLQAMPRVEKERLLDGCWYSREEASTLFQRGWVGETDIPPQNGVTRVRAYDLAGTLKSEANYDPDYSASVLMSRDKHGIFTIEEVERRRGRHGDIEEWILETAQRDGPSVTVIVPKDAGAAGGAWCSSIMRKLSESGFYSRFMPIAGKSKILRFAPFASAAHAGAVRIIRNCVTDTENKVYGKNEVLFDELESFDGGRKGHDDMADACADAYAALAKSLVIPAFELPDMMQSNPFRVS